MCFFNLKNWSGFQGGWDSWATLGFEAKCWQTIMIWHLNLKNHMKPCFIYPPPYPCPSAYNKKYLIKVCCEGDSVTKEDVALSKSSEGKFILSWHSPESPRPWTLLGWSEEKQGSPKPLSRPPSSLCLAVNQSDTWSPAGRAQGRSR